MDGTPAAEFEAADQQLDESWLAGSDESQAGCSQPYSEYFSQLRRSCHGSCVACRRVVAHASGGVMLGACRLGARCSQGHIVANAYCVLLSVCMHVFACSPTVARHALWWHTTTVDSNSVAAVMPWYYAIPCIQVPYDHHDCPHVTPVAGPRHAAAAPVITPGSSHGSRCCNRSLAMRVVGRLYCKRWSRNESVQQGNIVASCVGEDIPTTLNFCHLALGNAQY